MYVGRIEKTAPSRDASQDWTRQRSTFHLGNLLLSVWQTSREVRSLGACTSEHKADYVV